MKKEVLVINGSVFSRRLAPLLALGVTITLCLSGCGPNDSTSEVSEPAAKTSHADGSDVTEPATNALPPPAQPGDVKPLPLPDDPPPLVKAIGNWTDIAEQETVLPPFSQTGEDDYDLFHPEKICAGYLYGRIPKDTPEDMLSANPHLTINRIAETAEGRIDDADCIFEQAQDDDAMIMDFAVTPTRFYWVEASINSGENTGWSLYERRLSDADPLSTA